MSKVDSPEGALVALRHWAPLMYKERDVCGWSWDMSVIRPAEMDYEADVFFELDVAKQAAIFHPLPGREERVMRWIAKGKLLMPHFNAVLGEVYAGGTEVLD